MQSPPPRLRVILDLAGERVRDGLGLADLGGLADGLVAALRGHDRARHGRCPTVRGAPGRRGRAVGDLRVVGWSGDGRGEGGRLTLAPAAPPTDGLICTDPPLAVVTMADLACSIRAGIRLDAAVVAGLERARRACGRDGRLMLSPIGLAGAPDHPVELAGAPVPAGSAPGHGAAAARSVMGHIHSVNLESRRLALRAGDGCEWICRFDENLVAAGRRLLGQPVLVHGWGRVRADGRGWLHIEAIAPARQGDQGHLFALEAAQDRPPAGVGA